MQYFDIGCIVYLPYSARVVGRCSYQGEGQILLERVFGLPDVTESSEGAEFFTKCTMSIAKLIHGEKSSKKISGGNAPVT